MSVAQHPVGRSIALHMLPGLLIGALFILSAPLVMRAGFPPVFAISVVGITLGLGFQIWHLYNEGRKLNGRWSLDGIVLYHEPLPVWQYFLWGTVFVILGFLINGLVSPIGTALLDKLFPWLPAWFEVRDPATLLAYSKSILVSTFVLYLLLNGIAAPVIEEMYFRGYLMPRISRFGKWTPVLETLLFTVYHIWQPYLWITIFLSLLPVVYSVWWKKNIRLGIFVHMGLNLIGGLLLTALILGQK